MRSRIFVCAFTLLAVCAMCIPQLAFADDVQVASELQGSAVVQDASSEVTVNYDATAATGNDVTESAISLDDEVQVPDVPAIDESAGQDSPAEENVDEADMGDAVDSDSIAQSESSSQIDDDEASNDTSAYDSEETGDVFASVSIGENVNNDENDSVAEVVPKSTAAAAKKAPAASAPSIKNGWYTVKSLVNSSYALYVKGLKKADGTKIQLRKGIASAGFAFKFKKVGKYYRIIVGIATKKSVQVLGVKNGSGGIVSINSKKNRNTLFKLKYNQALGGYQFINVKTKQALSVKGGKAKNGAKIVGTKSAAGAKAQLFTLAARPGLVTTNIYSIKSVQKGKRALTANGSKGRFYTYIKESSQKWYVAPVAGKKNVYIIECISNGKRLTGVKNKLVRVKAANNANKKQWWVPTFGEKGIIWKNYSTKKPLSTTGKKCAEGSKAMNKKYDQLTSCEFRLTARKPVESGIYMFISGANGSLDLEVAGSKTTEDAIVQVNTADAKLNQKWIYDASAHTLKNVNSNLLLEAKTAEDGSMVVQAASTGAGNQKWTFAYAGGGKFQLVSGANRNYVLTAVGNATAAATNSSNVQSNTQKWKVVPTTAEIQPKGFKLVKKIVNYGHGSLKATYIVIHETANPGATALNHVNLWAGDNYYSDYAVHYVLDWTGICYQCVPEDRLCWQVGNGNKYVVGIELCHATTQANFNKVWDAGVQWAAWQLKKNGWGIDRLISHNECRVKWGGTDHTDPDDYFESFGKSWSAFKTAVKKALADY